MKTEKKNMWVLVYIKCSNISLSANLLYFWHRYKSQCCRETKITKKEKKVKKRPKKRLTMIIGFTHNVFLRVLIQSLIVPMLHPSSNGEFVGRKIPWRQNGFGNSKSTLPVKFGHTWIRGMALISLDTLGPLIARLEKKRYKMLNFDVKITAFAYVPINMDYALFSGIHFENKISAIKL